MISGILSFLFGILLLQQFNSLPSLLWCWLLISVVSLTFLPRYFRNTLLIVIGFLWALLRAHWVLDVALPNEMQGKDVLVTGVVASIPLEDERKHRFEFDVETLLFNNSKVNFTSKIRLSWYKTKNTNKHESEIKAGQRWQFWLRLKQPHGFMNPGGFDYEGWLYQKKIRATGYVRINAKKKQFAKKMSDEASGYNVLVLRQKLYTQLNSITSQKHYAGILIALAMGERSGITDEQWDVFRATGTSHLVAISGLHIGLLAGFIFYITRRVWPYCGSAALVLAAPRAAALMSMLVAIFYAALSGFAIPSQRALIMISIVMFSIFSLRKVQSSQVLSLALLGVLLLDPVAVLSAGFWLSFSAVTIISVAALGRLNLDKSWKVWGRLQWRISLALIPLLVFLFQQASIVSPITNLFAIPIISFLVVPFVLLASSISFFAPDLSTVIFSFTHSILNILWWILSFLADTPISEWHGVKPDLVSLYLASIGFILLLAPKGWPAKNFGFFLLLPLLWPNTLSLKEGEAEMTLLDVGQGLSVVIQTKQHTLVFDTGPKFSKSFDTGAAVVIPFIRQKNIKKLDMLIVSHKDNDHSGGLESIQNEIEVVKLMTSYNEKGSEFCHSGQRWIWDGVFFEMLNPDESINYTKRNNASCVLRVSVGKDSILLSADIEKKAEKQLVLRYAEGLESTFLVAPHHGSKTSSSKEFLETVNPKYVLIPVGYRNRYRMPHAAVTQRYNNKSVSIIETYKSGAISLNIGQKTTTKRLVQYRKESQKYWNSRH